MHKKNFTFSTFLLIILFCFSNQIFSQNDRDNPNVDRLPDDFKIEYHYNFDLLPPVTINGYDNFNLGVDQAEPHMSSNPIRPYEYFNAFNINGAHYTMDGLNWFNTTPNFGVSANGDPVTAYDSLGNLYYETMFGSVTGCKVIRSTDNGQTWTTPVTSISGNDKNWIACDQTSGPYANYVYTTMTPGNFARSTDFGASFQTTATLPNQTFPGMMVCVGPDVWNGNNISGGSVYVVTHLGPNNAGTYTFSVSTNGGTSFTQKSQVQWTNYIGLEISGRSTVQNMRTRPYPMIAADNSWGTYRGRLYCVYASNNPSGNGNKSDVFLRYSTDQGGTWSNATVVHDDANSQNNHQFFPAIWCDKQTGRLYIKWYDTRLCPTSDSTDVYATYTDDGGQTFAPNQRITNQTFKIKVSSGTGANYQGDYDAITSQGYVANLVWTDFRYGNFASFTGYFPDFAMLLDKSNLVLGNTSGDSAIVTCSVPSVKLYNKSVKFTAKYSPLPTLGSISLTFPNGDSLTSYPGSKTLKVKVAPGTTAGTYTINVFGKGPNGTPVHQRDISLVVGDVPVELVSFFAEVDHQVVNLKWRTATELNNSGFEIERSYIKGKTKSEWEKIGFVKGNGNSTEFIDYKFVDNKVPGAGLFKYRLKQIDLDGSINYAGEVEIRIEKPINYYLAQNFPNPFNPKTQIQYELPENSKVKLELFNLIGERISVLVNEFQNAGAYKVTFNGNNLPSGIYIYKLTASTESKAFTEIKKMTLMK